MPDEQNWGLLGWAIGERRGVLKLTQAEVADEVGVSINTVGRLEAGHPLRRGNLEKICGYLFRESRSVVDALLGADAELEETVRKGQDELRRMILLGHDEWAESEMAPSPFFLLYKIYSVTDFEGMKAASNPGGTRSEAREFEGLSLPLAIGSILKHGTIRDWRNEFTPDGSLDIVTLAVAQAEGEPSKRDLRFWLEFQARTARAAEDIRAEGTPPPLAPPVDEED